MNVIEIQYSIQYILLGYVLLFCITKLYSLQITKENSSRLTKCTNYLSNVILHKAIHWVCALACPSIWLHSSCPQLSPLPCTACIVQSDAAARRVNQSERRISKVFRFPRSSWQIPLQTEKSRWLLQVRVELVSKCVWQQAFKWRSWRCQWGRTVRIDGSGLSGPRWSGSRGRQWAGAVLVTTPVAGG